MKMPNIFKEIPKNLQEELFEDIISNDDLKIERIVSYGHTSPESGWYESELNEWVILMQGEARLSFDNKDDVHLKTGDYINIQALQKHKVAWTLEKIETIWLAIYYK